MDSISEQAAHPLAKFSLAGQGNHLANIAAKPEPILGRLCLKGDINVWYAKPNTGKTLIAYSLITDAVAAGVLDASKVFYVNADDSASGLAAKVQIADDFGIHCLAPGQQGFKLSQLVPAMEQMADNGTASGTLIVVDTLKKFADLMSKADCSAFGKSARQFSMAGGSLLGLAHTNKSRGANQKLIHAGTTDILEDFDSAYVIDTIERSSNARQRTVKFECIKNRGPNVAEAFYRYSTQSDLSYADRLVTVQETDPVYGMNEPDDDGPETIIVAAIREAINSGVVTKMAIAATVQTEVNISRRKALKVLDGYTGPDPSLHHWDFERKERGAHTFHLLSMNTTEDQDGA